MTIGYLGSYGATEVISHYVSWCMHNYEITVCNLFIHWDSPVIKPTAAAFSGKAFFLQKGEREVSRGRWRAAFSWQECRSVLRDVHHPCHLCGFVAPCTPVRSSSQRHPSLCAAQHRALLPAAPLAARECTALLSHTIRECMPKK